MNHEKSDSHNEQTGINPLITEFREFIKPPDWSKNPLVYIATDQRDFLTYPDRLQNDPQNLYRLDTLTMDEFMDKVYALKSYPDFRNAKKFEGHYCPGFNLYIVPTELDSSKLTWDYFNIVSSNFKKLIERPDWNEMWGFADDTLFDEEAKREFVSVYLTSGPAAVPHYHVNIAIGVDNYAQEWVGLGPEMDPDHIGEKFNRKFAEYGLRWSRMLTVRYKASKPGTIDQLISRVKNHTLASFGLSPEQVEEGMISEDMTEKIKYQFLSDWAEFIYRNFGMTDADFQAAYDEKCRWLAKKLDSVIIESGHRLGLTPLFQFEHYALFSSTGNLVYPEGGIVLNKLDAKNYSRKTIAYPAPLPDIDLSDL